MAHFQKLDIREASKVWNDLSLESSGDCSIAHNPALFSFFLNQLRLKPIYLIILDDQDTIGLLPLVQSGQKFISIPHFSGGGFCWKKRAVPDLSESSFLSKLINEITAEKLAAGFYSINIDNVKTVSQKPSLPFEVRQTKPFFGETKTEKVIYHTRLVDNEEDQFQLFDSNLRRKIRKAEKNGITVKFGGIELVDDFTLVYNRNMHQIGSPTLGKKFFRSLIETPDINAGILVAYLDDKPIGASFYMWYDGYCENTWFSTIQDYNNLYTSYLLHWEMIRKTIGMGIRTYSFGRSSKGSGTQRYKLQWDVEEKELFFSNTVPSGFSLKNQKWISGIWKRLPGFVVDNLGPVIAKRIY